MSLDVAFWIFTGFAFAFGAVVGSFLNVVIHRVPAGLSVVHPPSHCPVCENRIRWYDNIPIISWALLLRGKCRHCDTPISARYALVEALTGALTAALWVKVARGAFASPEVFAQTPAIDYLLPFGLYFLFVCLLVVITFVDLEHLIIPHSFTLPGMALGLAAPLVLNLFLEPGALGDFWPKVTFLESVIGLLAGAGTVIAIFYAYFAARGVAGIGGGDVTLMGLVGAWLGWPALVFVFFAASVQGTLAAVAAMAFGGGLLRDSAEIFAEDERGESADDEHDKTGDDEHDKTADDEHSKTADDESAELETDADTVALIDANQVDANQVDANQVDANQDEQPAQGGLAVPFGPFISLAAAEHFFIGEFLPSVVSMSYLYEFGSW